MNISIEEIKAFCRNNSVKANSTKNITTRSSYHRSLRRLNSFSNTRNFLIDYLLQKQVFILIHVQSICSQGSVSVQISDEQKADVALVRDGIIFYNGSETSIKVQKTKPFVFILKLSNPPERPVRYINASIKIMGKVELGKIKHFQSQQQANKYVIRMSNKQQAISMTEVIRIDWNQLIKKQIKPIRNSCNKFSSLRRLRSFNQRKSSHNTSISHTTNITQQKKHMKYVMHQFKTIELGKDCKIAKLLQKPKNHSQFVGKKKQNYASLYNSLKNNFTKNSSVISSTNPRTKQDIDKIYEEQKKRFNAPQAIVPNQSQAIQQDINHTFRKYSDSELDQSFEIDQNKKLTQSQQSSLAVSQYM